jgi:hypothetical protein
MTMGAGGAALLVIAMLEFLMVGVALLWELAMFKREREF